MKKVISLGIILIITLCIIKTNTIAAMQCNIILSSLDTTEVSVDDQFKVDVKVSDIFSNRGLVTFGAVLEYDKNSLKLEKIEGVGDYEDPAFNDKNGYLLIDRSPTDHNATMFTMTFKVLKTDNVAVKLKKISVSDGDGLGTVEDQTYTPKIKAQEENPGDNDNSGDNNQGGNNQGNDQNQGGNNNQGNNNSNQGSTTKPVDTTTKDEKLPQTGFNELGVPCAVAGLVGLAVMAYVKAKKLNAIMK